MQDVSRADAPAEVHGCAQANVAGTRHGCTRDAGRAVSARLADLFSSGAQVVDTRTTGASVPMPTDANGDVRIGRTSVVQKR